MEEAKEEKRGSPEKEKRLHVPYLQWGREGIVGEGLEEYGDRVDVKMLLNNRIFGLLPLQIQYIDNKSFYYYPAAEMISMQQLLRKKALDFSLARQLYSGICQACCAGREYFLQEEHFVLDLEYILWNPRKEQIAICYFPGYAVPLSVQMEQLSELLLQKIDHRDKRCVAFLYGMFELIAEEGFSLSEIEAFLQKYLKQENAETEQEMLTGEEAREKKTETEAIEETKRERKTAKREGGFYLRKISRWSLAPERIELASDCVFIGRAPENQGVISAKQISWRHASLEQEDGQIYLTDLNSTNGVFLNHKRIRKEHPVLCREGDEVNFADITYRLEHRNSRVTG